MGNKTRVVVTGLGAITPIGNDVASFWQGLKDKKVGIAPITYFDTTDYKAKLAGEVKDFDPKRYSTKEIAPLVHLTTGAIYARLDHLRKKLRKFYSV